MRLDIVYRVLHGSDLVNVGLGDFDSEGCLEGYDQLHGVQAIGAEIINHSCDPNLVSRILKGHVVYMSLQVIKPGEELTVNYNFGKDVRTFPCSCGSPSCGGAIGKTAEELAKEKAAEKRALRGKRTIYGRPWHVSCLLMLVRVTTCYQSP